MKVEQRHLIGDTWQVQPSTGLSPQKCQLVLVFGAPTLINSPAVIGYISQTYPTADILYASTAGEILQEGVYDDSIVVTAMEFEKTATRCAVTNTRDHTNSFDMGKYLLQQLQQDDLYALFVVSDGTHINGSELVAGLNENNTRHIAITGGLAGDGARFHKTYVGLNEVPEEGVVAAVGFYGPHLQIGHGSFGGWDEFGPVRTITRSSQNVLHEIDGKNALDLYKEYLGPYKEELPGSALLFPLSVKEEGTREAIVRTILKIDEKDKSMTFAGNMPEKSHVRLMKANFDKLIDASSTAARHTFSALNNKPDLAILISCVGRKLILQERTEEEVQAAREIFGNGTAITGFYSYGEISPFNPASRCALHNQTMTITTLTEC